MAMKHSYPDEKIQKKLKENLTDKEQAFVTAYAENGEDEEQAYLTAGYKPQPKSSRAKWMLRHLWINIEEEVKQRIKENSAMALQRLVDLCNDESSTVSLNAVKDLLSRAGTDATIKSEVTEKTEPGQLSDEELDEQIEKLNNPAVPELVVDNDEAKEQFDIKFIPDVELKE